jgi:hypothetical protein
MCLGGGTTRYVPASTTTVTEPPEPEKEGIYPSKGNEESTKKAAKKLIGRQSLRIDRVPTASTGIADTAVGLNSGS